MIKESLYIPEIIISDLAVGGRGVGRYNGKVVFVDKGIPGQHLAVAIYKNHKGYAEGRIAEVLQNAPGCQEPRCKYFSVCGGCTLQNIPYDEQLVYKRKWLIEVLERIGGISQPPVKETIPAPEQYFYRNKMEFSFSDKVWDQNEKKIAVDTLGLGLHLPGRYDSIIDLDECFLQSETSNRIVNIMRTYAQSSKLPAYSSQKRTGFWRFVMIREGKITGERLILLVTTSCTEDQAAAVYGLVDVLVREIPGITAVFHAEFSGSSSAVKWEKLTKRFGADYIQERIGNYWFRIECETFFQTNSLQAERLYSLVKEAGAFTGAEIVYDLFSGIGTIPIYISNIVRTVVGIEIEPKSVEAASKNAGLNGVVNCRFIQGRVRSMIKYVPPLFAKYGKPDVVIVDPPRSGLDPKTVERIISLDAKRIVYISCNPATLARDIKDFAEQYAILSIVPVDMFPQTSHIESVTTLVRKSI